MRERLYVPGLSKICADVAVTCEDCQREKYQSVQANPPVLRLQMKELFEMVVIDCVSLPRTARGHVGMIVMVDHMSKFVYAVPIKDKRNETVARMVGQVILPMCVCRPVRMLSDNGPEFVGWQFEEMLRQWGIVHVYATPYMPSANGLAERTVRTMAEILRMMSKCDDDWDVHVGRAVWVYNSTLHKSLGMSPSKYVLNFERVVRPRLGLTEDDRGLWKRASERFESFGVGDRVLREKFDGPYKILEVGPSGLSYVLGKLQLDGSVNEIRAHHSQLRRWREVQQYVWENAMSDWLRTNKCEPSFGEQIGLEDRQLVLVEYGRKRRKLEEVSERKKRKLCDKGVLAGVRMIDRACNTEDSMNDTYSVCGFELTGVSEISVGKEPTSRQVIGSMDESLRELDRTMNELNGLVAEFGEIFGAELEGVDEVVGEIGQDSDEEGSVRLEWGGLEGLSENGAENGVETERMHEGPRTRSRGPVPEHPWVLPKAI
ncbi:uncharacterized protein [Macrobrachium rosenbergii]|uniref:uncharacterized protein n=1 Tax=Macrobrachium rosenbergii TaxID=79674 RepID=UPI0034D67F4C